MSKPAGPIPVLGATGRTGRRAAEHLAARGVLVRAGSRRAQRDFDWDQPATWPSALSGTRTVYIAYQPDLAVPGAVETVGAFAFLATQAGAERFVTEQALGRAPHDFTDYARAAAASGARTPR